MREGSTELQLPLISYLKVRDSHCALTMCSQTTTIPKLEAHIVLTDHSCHKAAGSHCAHRPLLSQDWRLSVLLNHNSPKAGGSQCAYRP